MLGSSFNNSATLATGTYTPYVQGIYNTGTASAATVTGIVPGNGGTITISIPASSWFTGAVFKQITAVTGTGYIFW